MDSANVVGSNVGLSEWEGPLTSHNYRIPNRPLFGWNFSSSERISGDTDAPGKAASRVVADRYLVVTGWIPYIVMFDNFKRSYCPIANNSFLIHNVV
jgi:hypothetical protein